MLTTHFWKKYFEVYDVLNLVIPYQELMQTLCKELEIKKGDLVLDVGSGTGNLAMLLKKQGARVIGIDFSQEGIECHKRKDAEAEVLCCDITQPLPFPNNYFDKIVSNNVLYTVPQEKRPQIMKEFYRVLKKGGKIVISNVREGWKPIAVYQDAITKEYKKGCILKTTVKLVKLLPPTLKMFYYNAKIKKEGAHGEYQFMKTGEQRNLLSRVGFINISEEIPVYANQASLVSGDK